MAYIKYFIKGKQNPSAIYLRFAHGRKIDLKRSTSLLIDPDHWNQNKGTVRHLAEFKEKTNIQNSLNGLRATILNSFNKDYANGVEIDSNWLNRSIKAYFNQSEGIDLNYFTQYANYFHASLDNKVQPNGSTGVTLATKKKYRTVINKVQDFEKHRKKRLKLTDINMKFHKDFIDFCHKTLKLNYNTTGKYLTFIKTICRDAKKYGLKINDDLDNGEFRPTKEKVYFITLNEQEINKIFNHDFSNTPYLDNARNWLIIGLWSGARVGDLINLTTKNINNNFIEYTSQKTKQKIILPLHWQVKQTIENLNGQLPRKISSQKLNDYFKLVCKEVGLNEKIQGAKQTKIKKKVWRKQIGTFEKWELVSTHICRRSFATNHYGKLPTPVIMSITGHTTEKMLLNYIGKTARDNAEVLQKFWETQKAKQEQNSTLEVLKNEIA
jgi:integrase